jgi:CheY-like chemotaxis protein
MVVDDNRDAAETLVELLDLQGYTCRALYDAASTLDEARDFAPDALLIDIGMPGIDGFELARTLRGMAETASTRLVAITGYGDASHRERAEDAGFDGYLVKPVNIEELLLLLEQKRP